MIQVIICGLVYVGLIVFFIIVGRKWSKGNWLSLVAGYNTESQAEKNKYNIPELSKFMAMVAYINVVLLCLFPFIIFVALKCHMIWLICLFIGVLIAFDIYAAIHTNNYKNKNE